MAQAAAAAGDSQTAPHTGSVSSDVAMETESVSLDREGEAARTQAEQEVGGVSERDQNQTDVDPDGKLHVHTCMCRSTQS